MHRINALLLPALLLVTLSVTAAASLHSPSRPPSGRVQEIERPPQSDCSPSELQLRTIVKDLYSKHPDRNDFFRALDVAVGVDPNSSVLERSAVVFYSEALTVAAFFPYGTYRSGISEAIRKRESLDSVSVPHAVNIAVTPKRIDAPDIVKVIVERDGVEVVPISSSLAPTVMTTRIGAKRAIHAGAVLFPCSAFAPGATVVVTAIPESGTNMVLTLSQKQLERLK
jgi:hypothetical protein